MSKFPVFASKRSTPWVQFVVQGAGNAPISATSSGALSAEAGGAPFALVTPMDTYTVVPCTIGLETELALELEAQPLDVVERQSVVVVGVKAPTSPGQLLTKLNALIE